MLQMIPEKVKIEIDISDIKELNEMIRRNQAREITELDPNDSDYGKCPTCGRWIHIGLNFCSECGQRIEFPIIEMDDAPPLESVKHIQAVPFDSEAYDKVFGNESD